MLVGGDLAALVLAILFKVIAALILRPALEARSHNYSAVLLSSIEVFGVTLRLS